MSRLGWSLVLLLVAASARAQRTPLELRPRVGDTLRMRLDQTTEMSAARRGATPRQVVTRTVMLSRAIVESAVDDAVFIVAVTDSVSVTSTDEGARAAADAASRQLVGHRTRLRLSPDGMLAMADQATPVSRSLNDLVAVMPASFPREAVAVGDSWTREMPIAPSAAARLPGGAGSTGGVARATFRLDSLSRQGELAYISMHGTLEQRTASATSSGLSAPKAPTTPVPGAAGVTGVTGGTGATSAAPALGGTVTGSMVVDRRRGWLSESRFIVDVRTRIAGTAATRPMEFRMRVTQQMRVFGRLPAR